jgi:hypothetical protein
MADEREPTQQSQPQGKDEKGKPAKPMDIPVPKRSEFDRLLKKAEQPPKK